MSSWKSDRGIEPIAEQPVGRAGAGDVLHLPVVVVEGQAEAVAGGDARRRR